MLFLELSYQLRKVVLFFSYSTHLNIYAKCLCLQYILFSEKKNSVFTFETSPVVAFGKILRIIWMCDKNFKSDIRTENLLYFFGNFIASRLILLRIKYGERMKEANMQDS